MSTDTLDTRTLDREWPSGNPQLDAGTGRKPMTKALDAMVSRRRAVRADRQLVGRIFP
jgi:hypothetical protein